jgi:CRP-like cAMP-binding protein
MKDKTVFSGNLGFLGIADVLQLLGNSGSTGVLRLMNRYAPETASIYLLTGNPVDAEVGNTRGLEALFSLFGWMEGEFTFHPGQFHRETVIHKSRMEILLDGLRLLDDGKIPRLDSLSQVSYPLPLFPLLRGPFVDYRYVVDEEEFNEGEKIVEEGKYGNWTWVILEGSVDISRESPSGPLKLLRFGEGAFIGSIASTASFLLEGDIRTATATAVGNVKVGVLDSQRLASEFTLMSSDIRSLIRSLDGRLHKVIERTVEICSGMSTSDPILQRGKSLLSEGEIKEGLWEIRKGNATVHRSTSKGELTLLNLSAGDFFGQLPFLNIGHEPHSASVTGAKGIEFVPLDSVRLKSEFNRLTPMFRNILENTAACLSALTRLACDHFEQKAAKKA